MAGEDLSEKYVEEFNDYRFSKLYHQESELLYVPCLSGSFPYDCAFRSGVHVCGARDLDTAFRFRLRGTRVAPFCTKEKRDVRSEGSAPVSVESVD